MEDQEFDNTLRGLAGGSQLPFDARQWEHMAQRLDAFEAGRASVPRRRIPVYQWAAAAAAACLVVMAGLYISGVPEDRLALQRSTEVPGESTPRLTDSMPQRPEPASALAAQRKAAPAALPDREPLQKTAQHAQPVVAAQPDGPMPGQRNPVQEAAPEKTASQVAPVAPAVIEKSPQLASVPPSLQDYPLPDEPGDMARERRTAFGVHGGYNIGQAKNNFTLGVSVKRKLSERLHLETGLAFVSGAYKTYEPVVTTITTHANNGGGFGAQSVQTVQSYEASSNHLLYLQAAPTLNYRIYKGLTAGGGVDAQRLLGGRNTDVVYLNSLGEEAPAQPQWDFGVTARMDVQVARKLRAGMMYRESMRGVSKNDREAARRNYLLLQLSYTLF